MTKRMRVIVDEAKKRRATYLKQFSKLNISIAEFAEINKMTPARMGQLLAKARSENVSH